MMDVAEVNNKGMVAVRPFGGLLETPAELLERCQEHLQWNDREMADALRRQGRGEGTSRWEVLDFPGFDIAHRGASSYSPEHTFPAKALAVGVDYLEQNVVATSDEQLSVPAPLASKS